MTEKMSRSVKLSALLTDSAIFFNWFIHAIKLPEWEYQSFWLLRLAYCPTGYWKTLPHCKIMN